MAEADLKVCIVPNFTRPDRADGGIRRVVEAQKRYLPENGVAVVADPDEADLIACHGTSLEVRPGKPIVSHSHGLYWSGIDWPDWAHEANRQVVEVMVRAVAHTAPSQWVAGALRRGMLVYPRVIYHGVDPDEWTPGDGRRDYVLWNKARADPVSDPTHMQRVAELLPAVRFASTLGRDTANVKVVGVMPVDAMRALVQNAGVYLATARETFGIGTLEAMACGVPVVGWNWGGQMEIVRHGETGLLAKPGDWAELAAMIQMAIADRDRLGANARADVIARWTWPARIAEYADFYRHTYASSSVPRPKVSVLVTCHNLARYLTDAVQSVLRQSFLDFEVVVFDDASTDDTPKVARELERANPDRVRYVRSAENLKLAGARNAAFSEARGRYIVHLDADDMLAENALLLMAEVLDADPAVHITYGHIDVVNEKGEQGRRNDWPWKQFDWRAQMAHLNQLPYASMVRREVLERSGGYRRRSWRAEDAELWCRVTSLGFRAKKVTEAATLIYRDRSDSKSKGEPGDGDWTAWFPWRLAGSVAEARTLARARPTDWHPRPDLVPWGAQGKPANGLRFWHVHDHTNPLITVVVPVGPMHERFLVDTLDSLVAQTFTAWDVIVVNDTGRPWADGFASPVAGCPWARVIATEGGPRGPAAARNLGAQAARTKALIFLDADDYLLPTALERMAEVFLGTGGIVYSDWLRSDSDITVPLARYESWDFRCGDVLGRMRHAVTSLIPTTAHRAAGGFDETIGGWEDWDYFIALQANGFCSYRVAEPLFVYRFREGSQREAGYGLRKETQEYLYNKWRDYYEGRKPMPCGSCPGMKKIPLAPPAEQMGARAGGTTAEGAVLLIYQGPGTGPQTLRGPVSGTYYRFNPGDKKLVYRLDLETPEGDGFLQRRRRGVPDFLLAESSAAMSGIAVPPQAPAAPEARRPEFPTMPGVVEVAKAAPSEPTEQANGKKPNTAGMVLADVRAAVVDASRDELLEWLRQEQSGKRRKTIVAFLQKELARTAKEGA